MIIQNDVGPDARKHPALFFDWLMADFKVTAETMIPFTRWIHYS